jgi:metal-dependent amidase/aminoacylase/carboxypeptidase family protein
MSLANDPTIAIRDATQRIEAALIEIRRDIHAHPELGFEEVRTAGVVARELTRLGISHQTGVGKTGVVGLIEGGRPGPVLAIRADMDALPIELGHIISPTRSKSKAPLNAAAEEVHT